MKQVKKASYSSFFLFVTEFSNYVYIKNAVFNGKQKQMKWAQDKYRPTYTSYCMECFLRLYIPNLGR